MEASQLNPLPIDKDRTEVETNLPTAAGSAEIAELLDCLAVKSVQRRQKSDPAGACELLRKGVS